MTERLNFDAIICIPAQSFGEDEDENIDETNSHAAASVLDNWCAAACWGIPAYRVVELLNQAAVRLRNKASV